VFFLIPPEINLYGFLGFYLFSRGGKRASHVICVVYILVGCARARLDNWLLKDSHREKAKYLFRPLDKYFTGAQAKPLFSLAREHNQHRCARGGRRGRVNIIWWCARGAE
jgi:hypothetical protein